MGEQECDPEDIACQARTIQHLRGLTENIGADAFNEQFPELIGLEGTIKDKLQGRQDVLKSTLVECGIIQPDESLDILEEPSPEEPVEASDTA